MRCQKCIICFTFIAWLSTEMPTRLLVTKIRRNLYYQKHERKDNHITRSIRPMELLILFTVREFSKYNAGFFHYSFFITFEIIHFPTKIHSINRDTVRIRITMFSSEYVLNIHTCSGNDALFPSMYRAKTEDRPSFYRVFIANLMILCIYQSFLT